MFDLKKIVQEQRELATAFQQVKFPFSSNENDLYFGIENNDFIYRIKTVPAIWAIHQSFLICVLRIEANC